MGPGRQGRRPFPPGMGWAATGGGHVHSCPRTPAGPAAGSGGRSQLGEGCSREGSPHILSGAHSWLLRACPWPLCRPPTFRCLVAAPPGARPGRRPLLWEAGVGVQDALAGSCPRQQPAAQAPLHPDSHTRNLGLRGLTSPVTRGGGRMGGKLWPPSLAPGGQLCGCPGGVTVGSSAASWLTPGGGAFPVGSHAARDRRAGPGAQQHVARSRRLLSAACPSAVPLVRAAPASCGQRLATRPPCSAVGAPGCWPSGLALPPTAPRAPWGRYPSSQHPACPAEEGGGQGLEGRRRGPVKCCWGGFHACALSTTLFRSREKGGWELGVTGKEEGEVPVWGGARGYQGAAAAAAHP